MSAKLKAIGVGVLGLFGIIVLAVIFGFVTVPEGHVGVQTEKGAATGEIYEPGWHVQNPATQGYAEIETRPRTMTMHEDDAIYVITQDGQDVWVDVTIRYHVDEPVTFFKEYKHHPQAQSRLIEPTLRSDLRDEGSTLGAREIITKEGRESLEVTAKESLQENFDGSGLTLEAVQVRGVELNEEFSSQLEQIEIENAEHDRKLIEAEADAEAEITRAEGQAEANRKLDKSLTDEVLMDKYIERIDESDTVIVATNDQGVPIMLDQSENENDNSLTNITLNESVA